MVVVTNQSGVGRGYFPEQLVHDVHAAMKAKLADEGAHVDGVYYCPHVSGDNCQCRKPKSGMLQQAARDLGVDLRGSFVVGDRHADVELAHAVGAQSILVRTGYGEGELTWHARNWPRQPEFVAADLAEAVEWILKDVSE